MSSPIFPYIVLGSHLVSYMYFGNSGCNVVVYSAAGCILLAVPPYAG